MILVQVKDEYYDAQSAIKDAVLTGRYCSCKTILHIMLLVGYKSA
jgi:hypothetical protein